MRRSPPRRPVAPSPAPAESTTVEPATPESNLIALLHPAVRHQRHSRRKARAAGDVLEGESSQRAKPARRHARLRRQILPARSDGKISKRSARGVRGLLSRRFVRPQPARVRGEPEMAGRSEAIRPQQRAGRLPFGARSFQVGPDGTGLAGTAGGLGQKPVPGLLARFPAERRGSLPGGWLFRTGRQISGGFQSAAANAVRIETGRSEHGGPRQSVSSGRRRSIRADDAADGIESSRPL